MSLHVAPDAHGNHRFLMPDIVRETGATYRQLDYWTRAGYLRPHREGDTSGYWRMWSPVDLRVIRALVALGRTGATPRSAGPAVATAIYADGMNTKAKYLVVFASRDGIRAALTKGQPVVPPEGEAMWLMRLPEWDEADWRAAEAHVT